MNLETKWQAESDGPPHEVRLDSQQSANGALSVGDLLSHRDHEFVANAYHKILGRDPDKAGLDHFLSELRSGAADKIEILGNLRFSSEGRAKGIKSKACCGRTRGRCCVIRRDTWRG